MRVEMLHYVHEDHGGFSSRDTGGVAPLPEANIASCLCPPYFDTCGSLFCVASIHAPALVAVVYRSWPLLGRYPALLRAHAALCSGRPLSRQDPIVEPLYIRWTALRRQSTDW